MKYTKFIFVLMFMSILAFSNIMLVSAKGSVPKPTPTPNPAVNYNWVMGSNPNLLSETGDYSMSWWWWFKPATRPVSGTPFILMNHSADKSEGFGVMPGSAFSPNGTQPSDLVEFYVNRKLVSFSIYKGVVIVAPGRGAPVIVAAQNFGPKYPNGRVPANVYGIPLAGVQVFMSQAHYEKWLAVINP